MKLGQSRYIEPMFNRCPNRLIQSEPSGMPHIWSRTLAVGTGYTGLNNYTWDSSLPNGEELVISKVPPKVTGADRNEAASAIRARKPQQRGQLRFRKLLDSAAVLFVEQGVDATTIDEIVAHAGIAKGTFYHHFESKTSLLAALREDFITRYAERVSDAAAASQKKNYLRRLSIWVQAAVDNYIAMGSLYDIAFGGGMESARWTATDASFMKDFAEMLAEGNNAGAWSVVNPALTATLLFRGLIGVIDDIKLRGGNMKSVRAEINQLAARLVAPIG